MFLLKETNNNRHTHFNFIIFYLLFIIFLTLYLCILKDNTEMNIVNSPLSWVINCHTKPLKLKCIDYRILWNVQKVLLLLPVSVTIEVCENQKIYYILDKTVFVCGRPLLSNDCSALLAVSVIYFLALCSFWPGSERSSSLIFPLKIASGASKELRGCPKTSLYGVCFVASCIWELSVSNRKSA